MINLKYIFLCMLLSLCVLSGCSQPFISQKKDTDGQQYSAEDDRNIEAENENDKIIEEIKTKYAATALEEVTGFSAELVDNYKGKNLYTRISYIHDVFYADDELFMYAKYWSDDNILLKITPEQYSKIKTIYTGDLDYDLLVVFSIDNVKPLFPALSADFSLDVSSPDDCVSDQQTSVSFDTRIIQGTLVDIVKMK